MKNVQRLGFLFLVVALIISLLWNWLGEQIGQVTVEGPQLTELKAIDVSVDKDKNQVRIVLAFPGEPKAGMEKLESAEILASYSSKPATADILAAYNWGRTQIHPMLCGKEYPSDFCQPGMVLIFLMIPQNGIVERDGGSANGYAVIVIMGLEQSKIDNLLLKAAPPETIGDLVIFHRAVAVDSDNTAGLIAVNTTPPIYLGLKK